LLIHNLPRYLGGGVCLLASHSPEYEKADAKEPFDNPEGGEPT